MADSYYCTVTQWCNRKGYANFAAYSAKHSNYVTEAALELFLSDATDGINEAIGDLSSNITDARWTSYLGGLCYRMSIRMIDEEQARGQERQRSIYAPVDYMYEKERRKCEAIGMKLGYREVGYVG